MMKWSRSQRDFVLHIRAMPEDSHMAATKKRLFFERKYLVHVFVMFVSKALKYKGFEIYMNDFSICAWWFFPMPLLSVD